ncbi:BrnT family toxin [Pelagibacterium luteolum]|uniref:BrnT family toxin n=1 Tax=Pelagibacterium luteolum TaxID=440168 RepID=UPI001FCE1FDF|nr:BrnT family toxin [Pelagibacterium luteolum]
MIAFEWDPAKDRANIEKHGVGFATAVLIFDGPVLSAIDDRFDYAKSASIPSAPRPGSP